MFICVCYVCDCVAKWLKHLTVNTKIIGSSPTSCHWREKKKEKKKKKEATSLFLHLAHPGPSKIGNLALAGEGQDHCLLIPAPPLRCSWDFGWRGIVSAPASAWPSFRSLSSPRSMFPEVAFQPYLVWGSIFH